MLEQLRSQVSGSGSGSARPGVSGSNTTGSNHETGTTWGAGGPTISSTIDTNMFEQKEYVKKLEQSVAWLEDKLRTSKKDFKALKKENANLKDSNENHIFINEKLNKALKKSETRIEYLTTRVKQLTDETVVLPKKLGAVAEEQPKEEETETETETPFDGDMSSIMIKPD